MWSPVGNQIAQYELYLDKQNIEGLNSELEKWIKDANSESDIAIIGYLLRNNADSNLYIEKENEKVHVLCYIDIHKDNIQLYNTILLLLLASKSDINKYVSDKNNISIQEYWESNNKNNDFIPLANQKLPYSKEYLDSKLMTKIAILLDNPEYIVTTPSISEIIRDHSYKCLNNKLLANIKLNEIDLLLSIKYLNIKGYKLIVQYGQVPTYNTMNILLVSSLDKYISEYINHKYQNLHSSVISLMLEYTMSIGYSMDMFQSDMLNKIDYRWFKKCTTLYQKFISTSNFRSNHIENSLFMIEEEKIKDNIQLKKGALRAYTMRKNPTARSLYNLSLDIKGKEIIVNDKLDDLDLSYYTDKETGIISCYTPDAFTFLYNNGIHPFTKEMLPDEYMDNLGNQRSFLKRLGINVDFNKSEKRILIDNGKIHQINRTHYINLASVYLITSEMLSQLDTKSIIVMLKYINIDVWYLKYLSDNHQHMTLYLLSYMYLRINIHKVESYFTFMKKILDTQNK